MNSYVLDDIAKEFDYTIKKESKKEIPESLSYICKTKNFNIFYIVGDSGSGKTTILDHLVEILDYTFLKSKFNNDLVIASHFNSKEEAITKLCMSGIASIPSWFRSYNQLSKGEQARADIALGLNQNKIIIDEFTSNLDRLTARSLSYSLKKYVTKQGLKNIILAGCQYDIIPWLDPDFVFDVNQNQFIETKSKLPMWIGKIEEKEKEIKVPDIDSKVFLIKKSNIKRWDIYAPYHYLTTSLVSNAICWEIFVKVESIERNIGFIAVCPLVSGTVKEGLREHRLVILPSIQSCGLGIVLSETIAAYYTNLGKRYYTKTSHPRLGNYRNQSECWRNTEHNQKSRNTETYNNHNKFWKGTQRVCYTHEFIGKDSILNHWKSNKIEFETLVTFSSMPVDTPIEPPENKVFYPLKLYGTINQKIMGM